MHRHRWNVLITLCARSRVGVEVGVCAGRTTEAMLAALPNLQLIGVDPWVPYSEVARDGTWHTDNQALAEQVRERYPDRLRFIREPSLVAVREFEDASLDFVFIDGDHRYEPCLADIEAWTPKVRPGGMVIGHDFNHPRWTGVTQAVREVFGDAIETFPMQRERCRVWLHRL